MLQVCVRAHDRPDEDLQLLRLSEIGARKAILQTLTASYYKPRAQGVGLPGSRGVRARRASTAEAPREGVVNRRPRSSNRGKTPHEIQAPPRDPRHGGVIRVASPGLINSRGRDRRLSPREGKLDRRPPATEVRRSFG